MWVGKINLIDREKSKIIHLRQIRHARSQHYHILNLSFYHRLYLLFFLSFTLKFIIYFIFYFFLSLSYFNLIFYFIFYLYLSFILNSLSIVCRFGLHQSKYKQSPCGFDTRTSDYFTTCDKFAALANELTMACILILNQVNKQ